MKVKPIPDGYHSVTPYLIVQGASEAIAFYAAAFEAVEKTRFAVEGGRIMHAEIRIGDSPIMLADEAPEMDAKSPTSFGGSPGQHHALCRGRRQPRSPGPSRLAPP